MGIASLIQTGAQRHCGTNSQSIGCDDIAAGANTLEELYDLYEALLCCCSKAGIQVKASKVKFGVSERMHVSQLYNIQYPSAE